jgi:hypothetical protein
MLDLISNKDLMQIWMELDLSTLPLELDLRKLAMLDLTSNKDLMQIWPNDLEV